MNTNRSSAKASATHASFTKPKHPWRPAAAAVLSSVMLMLVAPSEAMAAPGDISTVAGNGTAGSGGDGGAATSANLKIPAGVAVTSDGGFLIGDSGNHTVRKVSAGGIISTVAGTGTSGASGDGGAATSAQLKSPGAISVLPDGGFLVADGNASEVRKVSAAGVISTVAGTGVFGSGPDGGAATATPLKLPAGVAVTSDGGFLVADFSANVIRKVSAAGVISTVAGNGTAGSGGDGGAATSANLHSPNGLAVTADGGFLIADQANNRVRRVSATGVISTVAGNGTAGSGGDGGAATSAELYNPQGVAATADGGFLIADSLGERIRKVSVAGVISTVAGTGAQGASGDGGSATSATLFNPDAVVETADGGFLISDSSNHRIRKVAGTPAPIPVPGPPTLTAVGQAVKQAAEAQRFGKAFADGALQVQVPGGGSGTYTTALVSRTKVRAYHGLAVVAMSPATQITPTSRTMNLQLTREGVTFAARQAITHHSTMNLEVVTVPDVPLRAPRGGLRPVTPGPGADSCTAPSRGFSGFTALMVAICSAPALPAANPVVKGVERSVAKKEHGNSFLSKASKAVVKKAKGALTTALQQNPAVATAVALSESCPPFTKCS